MDLIVAGMGENEVSVLMDVSDGGSESYRVPVGHVISDIVAADFDRDQVVDFAVASRNVDRGGNNISIIRGDVGGGYTRVEV